MKTSLQALQGSATVKVLFIGLLIILLLVPLGMIEGLIRERAHYYDAASANVATSWGEAQTIGGPILVVPFQYVRPTRTETVTVTDELYLLPDELTITGEIDTRELARGIYTVPVYTARLHLEGLLPAVALDGEHDGLEILWSQAQLALPLTDARSVREPVVLASGDGRTVFRSSGERVAGFGPQLVAPYAELGLDVPTASRAFSFDVVVDGTSAVRFLPLGDSTRVSVTSDWASPSFTGAYLPGDRNVTAQGFTAEWRVLDLGRGYPSTWRRSEPAPTVAQSAFGAELITPVGIHAATMRAAKYAVLIVGLTFLVYFWFELFAALRLHALQYLLIGLANCVFYVLLLALAEHIGFAGAYGASVVAATALITSYSATVLRSFRRAAPVGVLLAGLYGYIYVTLMAEDFALLIGAIGSFVVLATFMFLTRHVDWFNVRLGGGGADDGGTQLPRHP